MKMVKTAPISETSEPLNFAKHQNLRFNDLQLFPPAGNWHLCPISTSEFIPLARHCPIIFPRPEWPAPRLPMAMFALSKEASNRFVDESGKWLIDYIPAHFRHYPFSSLDSQAPDTVPIAIDQQAPHFQATEGESLFLMDGTPGERLQHLSTLFQTQKQEMTETELFVKLLWKTGILVPNTLRRGEQNRDNGYYSEFLIIDKDRLNQLSDKAFLQLRQCNALTLIHAHLTSLERLQDLQLPEPTQPTPVPANPELKTVITDEPTKSKPHWMGSTTSHLVTTLLGAALALWLSPQLLDVQPKKPVPNVVTPVVEHQNSPVIESKAPDLTLPQKLPRTVPTKPSVPQQRVEQETSTKPILVTENTNRDTTKSDSVQLPDIHEKQPPANTKTAKTEIPTPEVSSTPPPIQQSRITDTTTTPVNNAKNTATPEPSPPIVTAPQPSTEGQSTDSLFPLSEEQQQLIVAAQVDILADRLTRPKENNAVAKLLILQSNNPHAPQVTTLLQSIIDRYVFLAKDNIQSLNLSSPPGNNALEKVQIILKLSPNDQHGLLLMTTIAEKYAARAAWLLESAPSKGRWMLEKALALRPNNPKVINVVELYSKSVAKP
jgi:hypothetical protein